MKIIESKEAKRCRNCSKVISSWNKSGLCDKCFRIDYLKSKMKVKKCPNCGQNFVKYHKEEYCVRCNEYRIK